MRSTGDARTFASDPEPGELGRVVRTRETDPSFDVRLYLVRWDTGAETWCARSEIAPIGIADLVASAERERQQPKGPNWIERQFDRSPATRLLQRVLAAGIGLFTLVGFFPGFLHDLRHPSLAALPEIAAVVAVLALVVVPSLRSHR